MNIRKRKTLLMLSTAHWGEPNWTNKQHIAMAFYKRGFRVLYAEPPIYFGRWLLNIIKKQKGQNWLKKILFFRKAKRDFYIFSQFYLFPARFEKTNYYFGSFLNIIFINFAKFLLKFKKPYLINYLPYGGEYIGKFNERSSIYDCVDEYSGMKNIMKDIKFVEIKLMRKVNGVAVTARGLLPLKKRYNKNTILAHNVGNSKIFLYDNLINCKIPKEFIPFKNKKIIGFIGAVNFKIDTDLLKSLLVKFKNEEFVFIGPIYQFPINEFKKYKNIHFLGARTLKKIPCYVKYFHIAIIPYKIDEYTRYVFPLKLFEFFAAKIPVVSTNIPEVSYYEDIVSIGIDKGKFIENMSNLLKVGEDSNKMEKAYKLALKNSWENRAEKLWSLLKNV